MSLKTSNNLLAHLHNFPLTLESFLVHAPFCKLVLRVVQKLNDTPSSISKGILVSKYSDAISLKSTFHSQTMLHNLLQGMSSTRSQMVKFDKSPLQLEFV